MIEKRIVFDYNRFMIRKAVRNDIDEMIRIIDQAKAYLKEQGVDQWQDGYPNKEVLLEDIKQGYSYVLEDGPILGTMCFKVADDSDYVRIDGKWLCEESYGVIHRIAIDDKYKGEGRAREFLEYAIKACRESHAVSLRIDTHQDNHSMRRFLEKNGFIECGMIYIGGVSPRIAYERCVEY